MYRWIYVLSHRHERCDLPTAWVATKVVGKSPREMSLCESSLSIRWCIFMTRARSINGLFSKTHFISNRLFSIVELKPAKISSAHGIVSFYTRCRYKSSEDNIIFPRNASWIILSYTKTRKSLYYDPRVAKMSISVW